MSSVVPVVASGATGKAETIAGLALPFGESADIGGAFLEVFDPGAFAAQARDWRAASVQLRFAHVAPVLLATTKAGTLSITSDRSGLRFSASLPAGMPYVSELVRRQDLAQASVGFVSVRDEWFLREGESVRRILEARLVEISIVAAEAAAYTSTWVAARSHARARVRALEGLLAEVRAGRRLSSASIDAIQSAIDGLSALLASEPDSGMPEAGEPEGGELEPEEIARRLLDVRRRRYPLGRP